MIDSGTDEQTISYTNPLALRARSLTTIKIILHVLCITEEASEASGKYKEKGRDPLGGNGSHESRILDLTKLCQNLTACLASSNEL